MNHDTYVAFHVDENHQLANSSGDVPARDHAPEVGPEVGVSLGHDHLETLGLAVGTELIHFAIKNGLVGS